MTLPLDALFLISCLHIALFLLLKRVERVSCWRPARQPMMDRTAVKSAFRALSPKEASDSTGKTPFPSQQVYFWPPHRALLLIVKWMSFMKIHDRDD